MTVYVDEMYARRGRRTCRLIADTDDELHQMARHIGVAHQWRGRDHYEIGPPKRALAVAAGARAITWREGEMKTIAKRRRQRQAAAKESANVSA